MGLRDWAKDLALGHEAGAIKDGKEGPVLQRLYVFLAGKKTVTGAALTIALLATAKLGLDVPYAAQLQTFAHVLMVVGLLDKAWRADPLEIPQAWRDFYSSAVRLAPVTGLIVGAALDYGHMHFCAAGACPEWIHVVDRIAYLAAGLGLVGRVNAAKGPALPPQTPPALPKAA